MNTPYKPWAENEPREWLFVWFLVTTTATLLGAWLARRFSMAYLDRAFYPTAAIEGLIRGAWVGFGQWWLLRGRLEQSGWWIVLSCLGLGTSGLFARLLSPLGMVSGFFELVSLTLQAGLLGVIQWTYLHAKSTLAKWWIIACAAAGFSQYLLSGLVGMLAPAMWILDGIAALVWSLFGGVTMLIILDNPVASNEKKPSAPYVFPRQAMAQPPQNQATHTASALSPSQGEPVEPKYKHKATQPTVPQDLSVAQPIRPPSQPRVAALPKSLVLLDRPVAMSATREANTTASVFDFELLKRPRRARLQITYAGITQSSQLHFRQHVQLNGKVLKELAPRSENPREPKPYQIRIPENLFARTNRLIVVSRSDTAAQNQNPFRLHAIKIDFDWSTDPVVQEENSATNKV